MSVEVVDAELLGDGDSFCTRLLKSASRRRPIEGVGTTTTEDQQLRRKLNYIDLTLVGIGASIGAGVFIITGVAAIAAGPAVTLSFLIAAVGCVFSALCYAELAAKFPVSGSAYLYVYTAFGELPALLLVANLLIDYHVGAALGALSVAGYIRNFFIVGLGFECFPPGWVVSASEVAIVTAVLCVGVENGLKRINGAIVSTKLAIILLVIFAGLPKVRSENLMPFMPFGVGPVLSTSATCSFSFIGFDAVANTAEECGNPNRDLPIGIVGSLLVCALIYFMFTLVLCGIVPINDMDPKTPVAEAFGPRHANISWMSPLIDLGAIAGILTSMLAGLYSQARVYLSVSRDGLFFNSFAYVSQRFGTPIRAQLLCGVLAIVLAVSFDLERLVSFLNIGVLSSYTLVCGGVLVLRANKKTTASFYSFLVVVISVLSCAAVTWLSALAGSFLMRWILYGFFLCIVVASWVPLLWLEYTRPSTFACPFSPIVPLLGMSVNGGLLSQCHWQAWVRLLITTIIIVLGYMFRTCQKSRH